MRFNRDYFNQIEVPQYLLCKANGEILGELRCTSKKLNVTELNEISFDIYKYYDNQENELYDLVTEMKTVVLPGMYKFLITSVNEDDDGVNPKKSVTAKSIEVNLGQRYLEEFYINTGEDYAINGVCLYDENNPEKSLLNLVLDEKCPDWSVGYVDPEIKSNERYFEIERNDIYTFLTNDVANAFEAVVLFDSNLMKVNVYKETNYGSDTNVFVTFDNLLKNTTLSSSVDDIKTCMTVIGADDLNLREVNMGSDRIYMFDYYVTPEFMSQELCDAYEVWKQKMAIGRPLYSDLINQSIHLYDEINYLTNEKMPVGGNNLIHIDNSTLTINGITFTVNATDGTITANGTANAETEYVISDLLANYLTDDTLYRFIGCPIHDTTTETYYIQWYNKDDPTTKSEQNSKDDGSGNSKRYYSGYDRLSIFVHQGVEIDNKVFEPNIYLPDSKNTDWTKYGLVPLQEQLASYQGQQAVLMKAGYADEASPEYETMYLPIYTAINEINAQILVVKAQLAALDAQLEQVHESMSQIATDCSIDSNFTRDQIIELSRFIREDSINCDNYVITDEMTDSERIEMLNDMLEYGEEELRKVSQPQIQFSASIVNLFNIPEFDQEAIDFERGNYVHIILRDDYVIKAKILSIDIDFFDLGGLSVTFGNLNQVKGKTIFTDITKAINTASSVSTTVSVKSSYWNAANRDVNDINEVLDSGYVSANKSIKTSSADVEINDNGIILSSTDPEYPNDRIMIGGSRILFSDNNFETVSEAVGRVKYTDRNGVEHDEFGVLAQFVLAGYINGSTIEGGSIMGNEIIIGGDSDGQIIMYDAQGQFAGKWDKYGIVLPPDTNIRWSSIQDAPTIPTATSDLENDSDFATESQIPTKTSDLLNDSGYQTAETIKSSVITKSYIDTLGVVAGSVAAEKVTGHDLQDKHVISYLDQYNYSSDLSLITSLREHKDLGNSINYANWTVANDGFSALVRKDISTGSTPSTQKDYRFYQTKIGDVGDGNGLSALCCKTWTGYCSDTYQYIASQGDDFFDKNQKHEVEITNTVSNNDEEKTFEISYDGTITSYGSGVSCYLKDGDIYFTLSGESFVPHITFYNDNSDIGLQVVGDFNVDGNLSCTGTKNRLVETEDYGLVKMHATESLDEVFHEYGSARIFNDGQVIITFSNKFRQTIDLCDEYQVFITNTSSKLTSYVEKGIGYFIVHGENGATFDYMLVCKQK